MDDLPAPPKGYMLFAQSSIAGTLDIDYQAQTMGRQNRDAGVLRFTEDYTFVNIADVCRYKQTLDDYVAESTFLSDLSKLGFTREDLPDLEKEIGFDKTRFLGKTRYKADSIDRVLEYFPEPENEKKPEKEEERIDFSQSKMITVQEAAAMIRQYSLPLNTIVEFRKKYQDNPEAAVIEGSSVKRFNELALEMFILRILEEKDAQNI
ncbi:hypothetical protein JW968_02445 [Candidatus Woesearchaeota archaeon]|nr:hypothetical protein [Candidatus Woesearchaeota archaeon]